MNGRSFAGFADYEDIPLEQFHLMLKIHNEAVAAENRQIEDMKRARR